MTSNPLHRIWMFYSSFYRRLKPPIKSATVPNYWEITLLNLHWGFNLSPSGGNVTCCEVAWQCHCALWKELSGSVSSFVFFFLLFNANTKKIVFVFVSAFLLSHIFLFFPLCIPPLLCHISFCPLSPYHLLLCVFPSDEPVPECRRYVQVRNITKGDCRLDNVEVSFCRGRCLSRTDVILEVWKRDSYTQLYTQFTVNKNTIVEPPVI